MRLLKDGEQGCVLEALEKVAAYRSLNSDNIAPVFTETPGSSPGTSTATERGSYVAPLELISELNGINIEEYSSIKNWRHRDQFDR
jgi:hypothetical protein